MARVRPFRAWRYAATDTDLSAVAAPPYDVIDPDQRAALLARDFHNAVALELPDGVLDPTVPGNRYETGRAMWDSWREQGVLRRDDDPAVYVLEQRFELDGREVRRRAFIAEVGLEPFDARVVIPHERTLPKALGDRFELIKATGANLSQVFGLFDDEQQVTDALFESAMSAAPTASAVDDDGVRSTLWVSTDPSLADALTAFMSDRRIFIADGHHRYTTALAYRDLRREQAAAAGTTVEDPAYDHVMMALVNMDDPDLAVLPYHRIADADGPFDSAAFYDALSAWFDVSAPSDPSPAATLDEDARVTFTIRTRDDAAPRVATLRDGVDIDAVISADHSPAWKALDVAVLQELVLRPVLGIHPDYPETLQRLAFTKDAEKALAMATAHDVAFVMRPTRLDQLRSVSLGGEMMPQKSTYFYPKLLSGLVFRSAE